MEMYGTSNLWLSNEGDLRRILAINAERGSQVFWDLWIAVIGSEKSAPLLGMGSLKERKRKLPSSWNLFRIINYGSGVPNLDSQKL